jgi:hypothetical protein
VDIYLRLVQLAIIGLGLWQLGETALNAWRGLRAENWPVAPGRVCEATDDYHSSHASDLPSGHAVTIRYEYAVNGQRHIGERIAFFEGGLFTRLLGQGERDALVARYVPGQDVTVHYDPDDPARAVLEPGVRAGKLLLHALGGAFFLMLGSKGLLW